MLSDDGSFFVGAGPLDTGVKLELLGETMISKEPEPKQPQRKSTKKDDKPAVTGWAKIA